MKDQGYWVCPVCTDFFDSRDFDAENPVVHCLVCDHHYPLAGKGKGRCHNCDAPAAKTIAAVPTTLTTEQTSALSDWSKQNGYRRGVWELALPGGQRLRGGLPE